MIPRNSKFLRKTKMWVYVSYFRKTRITGSCKWESYKKNVCNASYDIKYMKNEWLLLFIVFELVNSSLLYILSWCAASCLLFLHVSLFIKSNVYLQYCQHSSSTVTSLSGGICMYYFQWSFLKYNIKRMPCAFLYLCWIKWQ